MSSTRSKSSLLSTEDAWTAFGDGHRRANDNEGGRMTYASILDALGSAVPARVEVVLDAMLEDVCGAAGTAVEDDDDPRWMSAAVVIEDGDGAAEEAQRWWCSAEGTAAADYVRRATRVAVSLAESFWRGFPPVSEHRAPLLACLAQNLRAVCDPRLAALSADQFFACLAGHFAATAASARRRSSQTLHPSSRRFPPYFRPEIRELCERFLAADCVSRLTDNGRPIDVRPFSHVEHLDRHVLAQRLADYASRYFCHEVEHFELADVLVLRFSHGKRGRLVEHTYNHRFPGPGDRDTDKSLRSFDTERRAFDDDVSSSNRVRDVIGKNLDYTNAIGTNKYYLSTNGDTRVEWEVCRFYATTTTEYEQRQRMKIECDTLWTAVHRTSGGAESQTDLTLDLNDGVTAVVSRRPDGEFDVWTRSTADERRTTADELIEFRWSDGQRLLKLEVDGVTVCAQNGTRLHVSYEDDVVCEVHVSDGTIIRTRADGTTEFYSYDDAREESNDEESENNDNNVDPKSESDPNEAADDDDKYVVCRRDLSGYEFADGRQIPSAKRDRPVACIPLRRVQSNTPGVLPATVVKTFARSHLNAATADSIRKMLATHYETVTALADRLNSSVSADKHGSVETQESEKSSASSLAHSYF